MNNRTKRVTAFLAAAAMITVTGFAPENGAPAIFDNASVVSYAASVGKVQGLSTRTPDISSIKLSWKSVKGADGYSVCMRKNGKYPEIADVKETSYTVTGLPAATRENFKVRAYKIIGGRKVYGAYSDNRNTATNPRQVTGLKAETINGGVKLSWKKVGCTNYRVFMYKSGVWEQIAQTTDPNCTVTNLDEGTYRFKVRACKVDDRPLNHYGKHSEEISADTYFVGTPTGLTSKTTGISSIKLSWNPVEGADGYYVGMRKNGQYPQIADVTGTTYSVTGLPAATRENFKVKAYKIIDGQKVYGDFSENWNTATNPRQVTGLKAVSTTSSTIKLSWNKVGCTSYRIFQMKNGVWKQIGTSSVNSYTVKDLKAQTQYQFRVRACKTDDKKTANNHYGAYSDAVTVKTDKHTIENKNGVTYVDGILIANKTYGLPSSYNPGGLTAETSSAFSKMQKAAWQDGISLWVCSGFRSYSYQNTLYNNYAARDGRQAADTYSARAGYSEHQTGLAIDVNNASSSFAGTKEAKWLEKNCAKYGFIIRYPQNKQDITGYKYEPWHVRYVGVPLAQEITDSGLCLEEYLNITSKYSSF